MNHQVPPSDHEIPPNSNQLRGHLQEPVVFAASHAPPIPYSSGFMKLQFNSSGTAVKFCSVKNSVPMKRQGTVGPSIMIPTANAWRRRRSVEKDASTKRVWAVARSSKQNTLLG